MSSQYFLGISRFVEFFEVRSIDLQAKSCLWHLAKKVKVYMIIYIVYLDEDSIILVTLSKSNTKTCLKKSL